MSDLDEYVRQLFKGGGILLVGLVVQLGISFLAKLVVARGLSVGDFGGVALGMTTASVCATVVLLGLNEGIARHLPRFENQSDRRGVLVSGYLIALPTGVLVSLGIVIFAPVISGQLFSSPTITPVIRIFGLVVPLIVFNRMVIATVRGQHESLPKVIIEDIAQPVSRIAAIAVVVAIGISPVGIAWAYFAGWAVPGVLGLIYLYRSTNLFEFGSVTNRKHKSLLRFSLPLLLSATLGMVFNDLDTLLLGYFSETTDSVGVYNVIYPLATLLNSAMMSFGFLFMPLISELDADEHDRRINRLYQVVTKWILLSTFPIFVVLGFFPQNVISLTFGAKYASGGLALTILATGFFVNAIAGLNRHTMVSLGYTRIKLYIDGGAAALNIVLNIILIPVYGIVGAAVATSVTYVLLNLAASTFLYKEAGLNPISTVLVRSLVLGPVTFIPVYLLIRTYLSTTPVTLVSGFVVFLGCYGLAIVRWGGVEEEEVMLVQSIEERFGIDFKPIKRVVRTLMPK